MRFIIDVDGVVADWTGHLLHTIGSKLAPDDVTQYDVFGLMDKAESVRAATELCTAQWWAHIPTIPGAKNAIHKIEAAEHSILWATAPFRSCFGWETKRRRWLRSNFAVHPDNILIGVAKERITGAVFIDDKISNVERWKSENPKGVAILFAQPYNNNGYSMRMGWPEILEEFNLDSDNATT